MAAATVWAGEGETVKIFDGETLEGWKAPDMSYWSVEDGAITGRSTEANPAKKNQFLVWQGGEVANFELRFKFRLMGGEKANSGVQVRSQLDEEGHAVGYQADISQPSSFWLGSIYDEHGRKLLAKRGEVTTIQPNGSRITAASESPEEAAEGIDVSQWTTYEIRFVDEVMTVSVGGKVMSEIVDNQESEREMSGLLAFQLHAGPSMAVQFKDIELKKLP